MDHHNLCYGCMEERGASQICPHCGLPADVGPESALHLPPGTVLQDKYLLGRALGQGGFGITYLAWDLNLNLKLAIKEYLPLDMASRATGQPTISIYKKELADSFQYGLEKYLEEARTLARFAGHPSIVWVRDFFKANGTAYIVMEYVEGVTLKEYLQDKKEPLPIEQALQIFMPVLDALKEVHAQGILHRDISPDNLLISSRGRVVLIDFGAARQAIGEQSRSLSVIMKPGFSPEEQSHSKGKQGPWTDIYAVAASLYCTITGNAPPESLSRLSDDTLEAPSKLGVIIDPPLEQALLKAMAIRSKDRYQNVEEFQSALLQEARQPEQPQSKSAADSSTGEQGQHFKPEPKHGKNIEKEILLSRLEADLGAERSIIIDLDSICLDCNGTGLKSGNVCLQCKGKGKQQKQKTLNVKIPAKVKEGTRIRLKGQGGKGTNGGTDGDLFLKVKLETYEKEKASQRRYSQQAARKKTAKEKVRHWKERRAASDSSKAKWQKRFDSKRQSQFIKYIAFFIGCIVLLIVVIGFFGNVDELAGSAVSETEEAAQAAAPAVADDSDSIYYIDYENGTIPIADLPIGAKVVDPGWEWEFRTGRNYAREEGDQTKPVTWIVVAHDHYEGLEPHVTLLSENLIGSYVFSAARKNHWGESDLRSWLNSAGFYRAFSESFKSAVLTTNVPNREWENGSAYSTQDKVFLPSTTELGHIFHIYTYRVGDVFPYFRFITPGIFSSRESRIALLDDRPSSYWARSPDSRSGIYLRHVYTTGAFHDYFGASPGNLGVRPALNLKAGTLVSEIME